MKGILQVPVLSRLEKICESVKIKLVGHLASVFPSVSTGVEDIRQDFKKCKNLKLMYCSVLFWSRVPSATPSAKYLQILPCKANEAKCSDPKESKTGV